MDYPAEPGYEGCMVAALELGFYKPIRGVETVEPASDSYSLYCQKQAIKVLLVGNEIRVSGASRTKQNVK